MPLTHLEKDFFVQIKLRIRKSQYEALKTVNTELIALYWDIGKAITEKQQDGWGKGIVPKLSEELQKEFPGMGGFSTSNLWYMAQLYTEYHDKPNLQPLVGEISWTKHILILSKCKDLQEREFYIRDCRNAQKTYKVFENLIGLY